ncbi:biotin--[acetyl-CoA-carboxylase] ligase [Lacticaseibacillus thailandensis]|nr:biotin--[acetyl-CoA-carboxylase] ligase [Lacticaseibacillus thailandensis]
MARADDLTAALAAQGVNIPCEHVPTIDSTNAWAERQLTSGRRAPFALLADAQSAGVGQRGHQFDSPARTGLYFTVVLPVTNSQLTLLMPAAGVAASRACTSVSGTTPRLKWVNDLFVGHNKISGILAWIRQDPSGQRVAVLGWGLNLALPRTQPIVANQPVGALWATLPHTDPRPA